MLKFFVCLLQLVILPACSTDFFKQDADDSDYFADALTCHQSSLRKEQVKVLTGNSMTIVDVPSVYDAGVFSNCMAHEGHVVPSTSADAYLAVSHHCYMEARGLANADSVYAACMKKSNIVIETSPEEK